MCHKSVTIHRRTTVPDFVTTSPFLAEAVGYWGISSLQVQPPLFKLLNSSNRVKGKRDGSRSTGQGLSARKCRLTVSIAGISALLRLQIHTQTLGDRRSLLGWWSRWGPLRNSGSERRGRTLETRSGCLGGHGSCRACPSARILEIGASRLQCTRGCTSGVALRRC